MQHSDGQYGRDAAVSSENGRKNLKIAPRYVDSFTFGNQIIWITEIPGLGGKIIGWHEGEHLLSTEAKEAAYHDAERLMKVGLVHRGILVRYGYYTWYITANTHRLFSSNWERLTLLRPDEDPKAILKYIHDGLFLSPGYHP